MAKEKEDFSNNKYEIVSVIESDHETGELFVRLRVIGTSQTVVKKVKEVFVKGWFNDFSKEDVAYLGMLVASEWKSDRSIIKFFPKKRKHLSSFHMLLAIFFSVILIVTNIGSIKVAFFQLGDFMQFHFPSTLIFFPFLYLISDVVTEVYGYKYARRMIYGSIMGLITFVALIHISILMPPSPQWSLQSQYASLLGSSFRIMIASITAFFVSDLLNVLILSKFKALTSGKYFPARALGSSFFAILVDSCIFVSIAYGGNFTLDILRNIILTETVIKLGVEALSLPLAILLVEFLKRNHRDVGKWEYPFSSLLNPFSLNENLKGPRWGSKKQKNDKIFSQWQKNISN